MQNYRLKYVDGAAAPEFLDFEATSLAQALDFANRTVSNRPVELWRERTRLGRLRRGLGSGPGFWQLS